MNLVSEVFNEHCTKGMGRFTDKFFDLAIPDPPYFKGVGKMGYFGNKSSSIGVKRGNFQAPMWDDFLPDQAWFNELQRVSMNQIIWGANYFDFIGPVHKTPRRQELPEWLQEHTAGWIVWDKLNPDVVDFNDFELAWTSFDQPTVVLPLLWNGMIQAKSLKQPTLMQGNKRLNEKRIHPTQKPLMLSQWTLNNYARPGHKILDTHMGSQGSRIAAFKMGFDYWGFEIDEEMFMKGNIRFKTETMEPLFNGATRWP